LFCCYSVYVILHSWLNKLIDWQTGRTLDDVEYIDDSRCSPRQKYNVHQCLDKSTHCFVVEHFSE